MRYFKNLQGTTADLYIYGDIVDDSTDWWTGEKDAFSVDPLDFKEELDELKGASELNIYINSGGGSVFAASTMVSMLKRFREQNKATINAYVDGLCASAATYFLFMADNSYIYENSLVMIHKPMTISWGNANDLQKDIDTLNTIENDMMIPLYLSKTSMEESEVKEMVNAETWFSGNNESENYFGNFFECNLIEETKQAVASSNMLERYKNTPKNLFKTQKGNAEPMAKADNTIYHTRIKLLKEEK